MPPPAPDDRYQRLIDRSAFGVFRSTLDGRFVEVNRALVDMLGYDSAEELLAADAAEDIYREAEHRDALVDDIARGRFVGWLELPWQKKSGVPITVRVTVDPSRDDGGRICWLDGLVEDLTEQRRRDEILRRNERMASLGKMLAGVAHELNNPLAAIGGFAQILVKAKGLSADDARALMTIHRESVRAAKIVKNLLDFARKPEAERAVAVDVNAVARYAMDTVQPNLAARNIRGEIDLAPTIATVRAQKAQIEQVVLNLVVNARQALEAWKREDGLQSTLGIRTREADGWVIVEVWDNGPGIRADHRARIWDPFWTTNTERDGGSGLGLSVVHGIVTAYGGTIDVETLIGRGTKFFVKLPAGEPLPPVASGT
jgi:two-component system NtrC family sensor kinase